MAILELEANPAIHGIPGIIGAGSHDVLVEAHALRGDAGPEGWRLVQQSLADAQRTLLGQLIVEHLRSGMAGMSDNLDADRGLIDAFCNLAQPHVVERRELLIAPELGRARVE